MTHALILIDLQRDFLQTDGKLPVATEQIQALLNTVQERAQKARALGQPVVYVSNLFPEGRWTNIFRRFAAIEGSPGAQLDPRCPQPELGDPEFTKAQANAFAQPELAQWLHARGITQLTLCGVFANACVRRTAEGALAAGFAVKVPRLGVAAGSDRARARGLRAIARAGGEVVDS